MRGRAGESDGVSFSPQVTRPRGDTAAPPGRWTVLGAVAACLLVVLLLGLGVRFAFGPQLRLDTAVSRVLYAGDGRSTLLNDVLQTITAPGLSAVRLVLAVPVLVLLGLRRAWPTAGWVLVAVGLIGPITTLIKNLVGRPRPQFADGGAHLQSLSFPSGHSSGIATAVVVGLVLAWPLLPGRRRRLWVALGAVLIVVVGFSRLWLGVHYLSDVVAGWSLGIAWSLLTAWLFGALPGGRAALPARP
jgi:membrane-associated phospholipid phosphatase